MVPLSLFVMISISANAYEDTLNSISTNADISSETSTNWLIFRLT